MRVELCNRGICNLFFGPIYKEHQPCQSASIIRAYVLIEFLNIIIYAIRQFVYTEEKMTSDWNTIVILQIISIVLYVVGFLCVIQIKQIALLKWVMLSFGCAIFCFNYEYKIAVTSNPYELAYTLLYLLPVLMNLCNEYSELVSYIVSSGMLAYIVVRSSLLKALNNVPISIQLQGAISFYLIYLFQTIQKKKFVPTMPSIHLLATKSLNFTYRNTLLSHISSGIIKFNKSTNTAIIENKEVLRLLSYDQANDPNPEEMVLSFISQHQLTATTSTLVAHRGKQLSIYCEIVEFDSNTYLIILNDTTHNEHAIRHNMDLNFFTTITHELRTPLHAIDGSFGLLKEFIKPEGEDIYSVCRRSIFNLKYLIRDALVNE